MTHYIFRGGLGRRIVGLTAILALAVFGVGLSPAASLASTPTPVVSSGTSHATSGPKAPTHHKPVEAPSFAAGPLRLQGQSAIASQNSGSISGPASGVMSSQSIRALSNGQAGNARISGKVTSAPNVPVVGTMVYAVSSVGGEYWVATDAQGRYTLTGLPASSYTLYFDATVTVSAKNLTSSENRINIDARIALKAQFRGRVTSGGNPVADAAVNVYSTSNLDSPVTWTFTDSSGNYFIHGLAAGDYKLRFANDYVTSGSYLSAWYGSATSAFYDATPLTLTATQLRNVSDVVLAPAAQIEGTVTNVTSSPVAGVAVLAHDLSNQYNTLSSAVTDASGHFVIRGLSHARYRLHVVADVLTAGGSYQSTWVGVPQGLGNSFENAGVISLDATQHSTGHDVQLAAGATISGTVSADRVPAVVGVNITVSRAATSEWVTNATTDAQGRYSVRGLAPGSYRLEFDASYSSSGSFLPLRASRDTEFTVSGAETITGHNVTLTKAAQISGKVTTSSGAGVAGLNVMAVGPENEWDYQAWTSTNDKGEYTLRGLPARKFKVLVDPYYIDSGSYTSVWSGGKASYAAATAYTLTSTQSKTGVNMTLIKAAQISSTITDAQGRGVPNVQVSVIRASDGQRINSGSRTNGLGKYVLRSLPAGSYKIGIDASSVSVGSYLSGFVGGSSLETATAVSVTSGQVKSIPSTALVAGVTFEADIATSESPVANANVTVTAVDDENNQLGRGTTDSLGHVKVLGIPAGTYKIHIENNPSVTAESMQSFWVDGGNLSNASPGNVFDDAVPLALALSDSGSRQIVAPRGAVIFGDVANGQGGPIAGVFVNAFLSSDSGTQIASGASDSLGHFIIRGLPLGTFILRAETDNVQSGHYLSQWVGTDGTSTTPEAATRNTISLLSDELSGGPVILTKASSISGNLTNVAGDPLKGVIVAAYDAADENNYLGETETDSDGNYSLYGLAAGNLKVRFDPYNISGQNLRVTWNVNKDTFATADRVTLGAQEDKIDVDGEVLPGAQITGKVTAKTGGAGVANVTVLACPAVNGGLCYQATTDATGKYLVTGLLAGKYRVQFDSTRSSASYLPVFWSDKRTWNDATVVSFASRQVRNMDVQLVAAAAITGRVTDSDGNGIENVWVYDYAATAQGDQLGASAVTDASGNYTLKGVPVGDVKLWFSATDASGGPFVNTWFNGKSTWETADVTNVASLSSRPVVNVTLANALPPQ